MLRCKYYGTAKGCIRGTQCRYIHDVSTDQTALPVSAGGLDNANVDPLHHPSDTRSEIPCIYFLRGSCRKGDSCPFSHTPEPLQTEEARPNEDHDEEPLPHNFTRELCGAVVHFDDGARISKVSLPSDFSAIRINGLPFDSTPESVAAMLSELGFNVPVACVRTTSQEGSHHMSADIRVEDPRFATSFCKRVDSARAAKGSKYSQLEVTPVVPAVLSESAARRVDCKKIVCSWHKPTRLAWLNFGRESIASRVRDNFDRGIYKILGGKVNARPPYRSAGMYNPVAWTVALRDLPEATTKEDITRAITRTDDRPRHIELGRPSYCATEEQASSAVKAMLLQIGPLDAWESSKNWGAKRMKAKARFQDEVDAREAVKRLNGKPLPFYKDGKLFVQLITSAKFKIPTRIYNAVRSAIDAENRNWSARHLVLRVYEPTDASHWYTTLKLEGAESKGVAEAKETLEKIVAGTVALEDGIPIWSNSFNTRSVYSQLKEIQQDLGVVIVRNRRQSQLSLYGRPTKCEEAMRRLCTIARADFSTVHYIELDPYMDWLVSQEKFRQIVATLGKGVAAMDTVSTPKKIIITGSTRDFETALAIYHGQRQVKAEAETGNDTDCTVCWSEAENPIRTMCNHLYCLDCFEKLCLSVLPGEKEFTIRCVGDKGQCNVVFGLHELHNHLSSSSFEEVLEASFSFYIRQRPQDFHYCPTPDCDQVYRSNTDAKIRTCPKCCVATCTSCHSNHDGMTCSEYMYRVSGEYEAFEKLKQEKGFKDCPKCKTTMEKTEGCNHMTCPGCQTHVCWVCLKTFATSGPCYDHLNKVHGGIGLVIPPERVGRRIWGFDDMF
ncbi:hypothetical protein VTN77DRAFT_4608 [Rasamsonia byssochlamydoides]|uniref:uncharacterized protein n=1 Tax=Rasamsonia byssochlamydoides TaxID=89139 RepID=UPI003743AFFA